MKKMIFFSRKIYVCITSVILIAILNPVSAIKCFQCESTDHDSPFQCNEFMPEDSELQPTSCDSVHNAQYCIKLVGRNRVSGWFWSNGGIKCYQCSSHTNLDCADNAIQEQSMEPQDCGHIHEAKYCIKMTGRNKGVYGTSRQCSSVDLGNYCDYIQLQGDVMDYRSCVYTCDSDGCNSADLKNPSIAIIVLSTLAMLIAYYF